MKRAKKGLLVVVSAASGAGKSTLCRKLLQERKMVFSVSATTRQPRPGEVDGRDYFFLSEAAFEAMRDRKELAEWANVHGQMYGTPKQFLETVRTKGQDVLLDLDVQGALAVKRQYPEAVLIFIRTPHFSDLEKRLRHRSSETEVQINRRLATARKELRLVHRYDYEVVNDKIPKALAELKRILDNERSKQKEK